MRAPWSIVTIVAAYAALTTSALAQDRCDQLYSGFVLVDPETATSTADAWIVVRNGRIARVGSGMLPDGDFDHRDMQGLFAMPGLIDAHAHITAGPQQVSVVNGQVQVEITSGDVFSRGNAAIALAFGVTSVRDPGGSTAAAARYDEMIAEGVWAGPEARHAGALIEPPPFGGESSAYPTSAREWNAEAARQSAAGMTYFKLYTDLSEEELSQGVEAARANGLIPIAHLNAVSWARALELGVEQFEHALPTSPALLEPNVREDYVFGPDFMTRWWELAELDGPLLQGLATALAEADAEVTLTLMVNRMVYFADDWETVFPEMASPPDYIHPAHLQALEPAYAAMRNVSEGQLDRGKAVWPKVLAFAKLLHERGVPLMIGTDGSGGLGLYHELGNHVRAGIPTWEVLRMVTSGNASHIGLARTGRIAPGFDADIVFLSADPTTDVRNVGQVEFVVNNGELFDHETLLQSARELAETARSGAAQ